MSSPEQQTHTTIEESIFESIMPITDREVRKAIIRRKCAELGKSLGFEEVQGKVLAQYYFKMLDIDPERADKFWEALYNLHYHATDPVATKQNLTILSGLTTESGLTYLWNLAQGIIRGEYEVLHGDIMPGTRCYFLYYRADAEDQRKNPKRHASLKTARELVDGIVLTKPPLGLRKQDFVGLSKYETDQFRGICKTIGKHIDVLLNAKVEIEDIFEYFEWIKSKLNSIIKELGVSEEIKARYQIFVDSVVVNYLSELYDYASDMSEKEQENEFVRDIMNESFVIFNGTVDDDHIGIPPVERLRAEWSSLKTNLTAFHQDPQNANDAMFGTSANNNALDQTVFFVGGATPVLGEPIPTKSQEQAPSDRKKTQFGFPAYRGDILESKHHDEPVPEKVKAVAPQMIGTPNAQPEPTPQPKPTPTPQVVAASVQDSLKGTKLGMTTLTDEVPIITKSEQGSEPLAAQVEEKTVVPEESLQSPTALFEEIRGKMPSYKIKSKMRAYIAKQGIIPRLDNYEKELKTFLNGVEISQIYSDLEEVLRRATDPLYIIQQKAEEIRNRLDELKKRRKEFTGGWWSISLRGLGKKGKGVNQEMTEYFDQIDSVIEELWEKEITTTLNKFAKQYA
ncbi:hypothetical protein ACFL3T_02140 [Patescibacteria group bacterium]